MGTANGYTKQHMKAVEDACIVAGAVDLSGHLQLTRHDGTSFDAGSVVGPAGPSTSVPTGTMLRYGGTTLPDGFFWCDGSSLLRTDYPALFSAIGTKYGSSDASHFYLPDRFGFRAASAAATSIPVSTFTIVSGWGTDAGYVSKSGRYYTYSGGTWTFVTPDDWDVSAQIGFNASTTGPRVILQARKNGAEIWRSDLPVDTRSAPPYLTLSFTEKFAAGDTLELYAYQTSTAALGLSSNPGHVLTLFPRSILDIIKY